MCGICGVINRKGLDATSHSDTVRRMCNYMIHRGPDDEGVEVLNSACIGHRRLSIIDTSILGRQPFITGDKRFCLSANGEIYNYLSYRSELEKLGCRFKSQSDSEVILHGYLVDGVDVVKKLRGMFAFAIYDKNEKILMLARDRQGIKPLYYYIDENHLIFASELKPILKSGLVPNQLNPISLYRYFTYGVVPEPETLIRGIKILLPGNRLIMRKDQVKVERYWQYPSPSKEKYSQETASLEVRQLLDDSIKVHLQTDVPLGIFLSGGIDSTIIASLAVKHSSSRIKTFSIGFEDGSKHLDERSIARKTANYLQTEHHEYILTGYDIETELQKIITYMHQPSFDGINTYFISKFTRDADIKVALSGLGGDELFGGYGTYKFLVKWGRLAQYWGVLPSQTKKIIIKFFTSITKSPLRKQKLSRLKEVNDFYSLYALVRANGWFNADSNLYKKDFSQIVEKINTSNKVLECLKENVDEENHWRMTQKLEMKNYMCWRLLRDTDAMSMAHSIETRVPLIDDKIIDYVMSLPTHWYEKSGWPKKLLVESASDIIPKFVLNQPKQGFQLPMNIWMNGNLKPIVKDIFLNNSRLNSLIFNYNSFNKIYEQFKEGKLSYEEIWKYIVLELWFDKMNISPC